jgi:hypothetical protein
LVIAGFAFGATYVYNDPELQHQIGITEYVNQLPWKHDELVAKAKEHPLDFESMSIALSTRAGEAVSSPKSAFTDTELSANHYLKWQATFKNALAGLDGQEDQVEARVFDPKGAQIALSDDHRFVGPGQTAVDFSGVALMPDNVATGDYKVALYSDDQLLGQQEFSVSEDLAAKAAAARAKAEQEAAARAAETKRREDARKLAMLQERTRHPLQLLQIVFLNTTKDGTALSGPTTVFSVSKLLFVGWRVSFGNRLYGLDMNRYEVDAAYVGPDGSTLGSVQDVQVVNPGAPRAVFSGRVGNSAGGAFLPGQYTVNFYLNGQYFAQRKFRVISDTGAPYAARGGGGSLGAGATSTAVGLEMPLLATGTIEGLGSHSLPMELRLRPQANGFLHGELIIHSASYGPTPLEGFVRGDKVLFQVPYKADIFDFEGQRDRDELSGTFRSDNSGQEGSWHAHVQ